jgi:mannosyl-3-phosphoglycerate phosphatase
VELPLAPAAPSRDAVAGAREPVSAGARASGALADRDSSTWGTSELLVVTDLDGSLLDEAYSFEAARPALTALEAGGIPLVLASSKTRAEMVPLAERIGLCSPLIVENGGAILVFREQGYEAIARGVEHSTLRRALEEIGRETGAVVRGLSSFDPADVAFLTGLDSEAARLALTREHDEPFIVGVRSKARALQEAAARRGLRVTRGGRFFHLTGDTDKGQAFRQLLDLLGKPRQTLGLGDAQNDLPLLEAVDRPIVVPRGDCTVDPDLARALPDAELAPAPGPLGWNAAVMIVLAGGTLPTVSGRDAA